MNSNEISEYQELINDLLVENIGDSRELRKLSALLTGEKDLSEKQLDYLAKLDVELQKNIKSNEDGGVYKDLNVSISRNRGGNVKKFGIGIGILFLIAVIAGFATAFDIDNDEDISESKVSLDYSKFPSKASLVTEEHVKYFISNYKGQDNSGDTLLEVVSILLNILYPNENILENPTTTVNYYALIDFERDLSGRYWTVHFEIDTYRETVNWVWLVDTGTSKIYHNNQGAKGILDVLDTFD